MAWAFTSRIDIHSRLLSQLFSPSSWRLQTFDLSTTLSNTLSRARTHAVSYHPGSSSHNSPWSGEFNVNEDGFLDSEHRSGDPYLCSLPSTSERVNKDYDQQYHFRANCEQIIDATKSILGKRGMAYLDISAEGRQSCLDPESEAVPTVIVVMQTMPSQAGDAAREIHHSLRAKFPGICVDIMDDTFARPFQFFPVSRSDEIFGKWNGICARDPFHVGSR